MFALEPPGPHAELDSASRCLIGRDNRLRQHRGVAEGDRGDQRAEPDALGSHSEGGEGGPGIKRTVLGGVAEGDVVV